MAKALKGCLNEDCKAKQKHTLFPSKFDFCPICGSELFYVCKRCGMKLESNENKYCVRCYNIIKDKKDRFGETVFYAVADAAKDVGDFVVNVGGKVADAAGDLASDIKDGVDNLTSNKSKHEKDMNNKGDEENGN